MSQFIKLCVLAIALSVSFGCTKKSEVTSVSMQMPDWNKLTQKNGKTGALSIVKVVNRVMINITGPDIATPIVYIWQMEEGSGANGTFPTPPAEFELTVPRGSNRLIQVLTLIQDYNTATQNKDGETTFYYGDVTKSLINAVEPVNIALAVASNSSQGEGSISGRYFNADGSTPTGMVNMYFALPGKNPMIVERTSIFSGYFNFFLLPDVPFTYRLENGAALFESITTASFSTGLGGRALHVAVPQGYREYSGGGSRSFTSPRRKIMGFFGPGAALTTREMCYPETTVNISGFYDAAVFGDLISWYPTSSNQTDARVISGGVGDSGGLCASVGEFGTEVLNFSTSRLINGDSPLPMRGPFREFTSNGYSTFLNVSQSGLTQLTIDWSYLPGVAGNSVDGVGVFYRIYDTNESLEDGWHDSAPCNKLGALGFTEITRVAAGAPQTPVSEYVWSTTAAIIAGRNAGRLKTILCPYSNAKSGYYDFAISHYNSSGYSPTATQILASSLTEPNTIFNAVTPHKVAREECTAIRVRMADASGNSAQRLGASSDVMIGVTINGGASALLFEDRECSTPYGGSISHNYVLDRNHGTVIFVRGSNGQITDYQLTISDATSGGTPLPTISHHISPRSPESATDLLAVTASAFTRWQCYPYVVTAGFVDGTSLVARAPVSAISVSLPYLSDQHWYSDSDCWSPTTPSMSLGGVSTMSKLYVRYAGTPNSVPLTPISNTGGLGISGPNVPVSEPAAPTRLRLEGIGPYHYQNCTPVRLVAYNNSQQVAPVTAVENVAFSYTSSPTTGEGLFSDSNCTPGYEVTTITHSTNQATSTVYYFRWMNAGPLGIIGSGSILPIDTINTEVQP